MKYRIAAALIALVTLCGFTTLSDRLMSVAPTVASFGLTYVTTVTGPSCSVNVCTFSSVSLGSATSSKQVVLGITARQAGGTAIDPLVSVAVGASTATQDCQEINSAGNHTDALIYRVSTSDTSDNIVITFAAVSTLSYVNIAVWQLVHSATGPHCGNGSTTASGSTTNANVVTTAVSGGGTVGIANSDPGATATSATGISTDVNNAAGSGGGQYSAGHSTGDSAGSFTVGLVMTGGTFQLVSAYASYGP